MYTPVIMGKYVKVAALSMAAGGLASLIIITVGAVLDRYMSPELSNIIALFTGLGINFFLQQRAFVGGRTTETISQMRRYVVADIAILISNQWLFTYLMHHRKEYEPHLPDSLRRQYSTTCRVSVALMVWFLLSFPLRRYWVFVRR